MSRWWIFRDCAVSNWSLPLFTDLGKNRCAQNCSMTPRCLDLVVDYERFSAGGRLALTPLAGECRPEILKHSSTQQPIAKSYWIVVFSDLGWLKCQVSCESQCRHWTLTSCLDFCPAGCCDLRSYSRPESPTRVSKIACRRRQHLRKPAESSWPP